MLYRNHLALRLLPLALLLLPEFALAQAADFDSVTSFLQTIAHALFIEWGFYIACFASAAVIFAGWSGHMTWGRVIQTMVLIVLFFGVPNIVAGLRDSAGTNI